MHVLIQALVVRRMRALVLNAAVVVRAHGAAHAVWAVWVMQWMVVVVPLVIGVAIVVGSRRSSSDDNILGVGTSLCVQVDASHLKQPVYLQTTRVGETADPSGSGRRPTHFVDRLKNLHRHTAKRP